ncbi:MAG TPA: outer membrane protein assembly factor BamD [Pyrinomonadaceae bacterium]
MPEQLSGALALKVLICLAAATMTVIACGWMGTDQSVRFNSYQTEREMGRLPPLPTLADGKTELQESWGYEDEDEEDDSSYEEASQREKEINAVWDEASAAEQKGEMDHARTHLRQYLEMTKIARDPSAIFVDREQRRNSAIDRLDAMTALGKGAGLSTVQAYLDARRAYDSDKSVDEVNRAIAAVPANNQLTDNVAYLRAALLYRESDFAAASRSFNHLATHYPQSEKREAALFMSAVAMMKTSKSYTGISGDEAHQHAYNQDRAPRGDANARATAIEEMNEEPLPLADCCDSAWTKSLAAFRSLLSKYPRGRYSNDARGWIAYLRLRGNDRAGALVEYYRLLSDVEDRNAQLDAAFSLTLVRHHATDAEMQRVEMELEDEPAPALAYAYHEIYNYLINPGCQFLEDWPDNQWEADRQKEQKDSLERAGLERVVAFATRLMKRYTRAAIGGSFALRLASANLELGENDAALEQAKRALTLNVREQERARALWVKGVAEHRLHDYEHARSTLTTLVNENPQGELTEGARRMLAMSAEDAGDMDAALEQYLQLKYDTDVAYFIDVLMTPEQLNGFIERHPNFEKRDEFLYALGIRYMRLNCWSEARAAFARLKTTGEDHDPYRYISYDSYAASQDCHRQQPPGFSYRCDDPKDKDFGPGVTSRLLLSDLKTIDDIERLERDANEAQGDEAKAEALYQLASYLYESSTLLFYNPIAWHGMRHYQLITLQSGNKFRAPDEAARLWRDMQEHEPIARALVIYLDVVRRYPQTRAARDALYTAAVCHERLADYNDYWRSIYSQGLHAGDRMVTYADVKKAYPNYQLPRSTVGWEPVTRTVGGGPGWAAKPVPRPRLTLAARLRLRTNKIWTWFTGLWEDRLRHWIAVALSFASAFFASFCAGRARKLLRGQLARNRNGLKRRRLKYRWLAAHRRGKLLRLVRAESKTFVRRARTLSLRLMLKASGRRALALNLAAHTLLIVLLVLMMQTMSSG